MLNYEKIENSLWAANTNVGSCRKEPKRERVLELNRSYAALEYEYYRWIPLDIKAKYENCRQSCVLGFTLLSNEKTKLVNDAKTKFVQIPTPKETD